MAEIIIRDGRDSMDRHEFDFEVGYGKPPKAHRWKKGQSGNPSGKRKGKKRDYSGGDLGKLVAHALLEDIPVAKNGRQEKLTPLEVLSTRLVSMLLQAKGPRDIKLLLEILQTLRVFDHIHETVDQQEMNSGPWTVEMEAKFLQIQREILEEAD